MPAKSPLRTGRSHIDGGLDQHGKAVHGIPGPGAYDVPRTFRQWPGDLKQSPDRHFNRKESAATTTYTEATSLPADQQPATRCAVYKDAPAFTLARRAFPPDGAPCSPGPLAYTPSYKTQDVGSDRAVFGTASRDQQAKVFISRNHSNMQIPTDSPGPGTYRVNKSSKIANTIGSGPTMKFGSSPQRPKPGEGCASTVGAAYKVQSTIGEGPSVKLAAHGELERGAVRNRSEALRVFISQQHGQADNFNSRSTPAPNHYKLPPSDMESRKSASPKHAFTKRERFGSASKKEYLGPLHTADQAGKDSADTLGPPTTAFDSNVGPRFSPGADRFVSPDKGPHLYMGKLACMSQLGAVSQGAIYNVESSIGETPSWSFGSSSREVKAKAAGADGPGPGAYNPQVGNTSFQQAPPAYSVASNLRSSFITPDQEATPGPGAYSTDKFKQLKPTPKGTRFGFAPRDFSPEQKERESIPGPGCYESPTNCSPTNRGFSFGLKEPRRAGGQAIASVRYHGPLASCEGMGIDSPGPAAYGAMAAYQRVSKSADAACVKFDRADRSHNPKLYISKLHSSCSMALDSPGPGAYDVKEKGVHGFTSKYKSSGSFSFGSGARTVMAKVKF